MANILINAAQDGVRIAITDENNKIRDLIFEHPEKEDIIHNIYKGVITGVETSLNAAFVNYGADRHGFLPLKDISPRSLHPAAPTEEEAAIAASKKKPQKTSEVLPTAESKKEGKL